MVTDASAGFLVEPAVNARDLVVVGASAGGVEALRQLVSGLPGDLRATVLIVLHIPRRSPSALPAILNRSAALPARQAADGDELRPGEILVAPPDSHMLVEHGRVSLSRGPQENGHRPAVDALFRSAARAAGRRVVSVVLSGTRDDGTAGADAIVRHGGLALVQDPTEALYAGMPRSVLEHVPSAEAYPVSQLSQRIVELVGEPVQPGADLGDGDRILVVETEMAHLQATTADEALMQPAGYGCPSCHGSLFEVPGVPVPRYRCRIGHAWSSESLLEELTSAEEGALWMALRSLEEKASLCRRLAFRAEERGHRHTALRYDASMKASEHAADLMRELIGKLTPAGESLAEVPGGD